MREYREYYIAVLDILGFKNAISKYDCEEIASVFDEINEDYTISYDKTGQPIVDKKDLHIKVMSDTICIFVETNVHNALTALIATCDYLQVRMLRLQNPILSRGAIVRGQIYHENDILFGQGFVDAYCLEEKEAVYPRVIIDSETIETYKCYDTSGKDYLDKFLIKDFDGKYISDYIFLFYGLNHEQNSWKNFVKYVEDKIEKESNDGIRKKYIYLRDNFSRVNNKYISYLEENNYE